MDQERLSLSDSKKEQIKLRATFLNNIGIGVLLIGVFTPIIRVVYGDVSLQVGTLWLAVAPTGCFLLGIALHLSGGWILRGLSK
ncbi:hypothetical protein [Neorhizobium alkalisoli]|uniref:Uncharacterized protein n=1 Tax=Neorhizobium alkalisoli TaxID=528178 RepID=A0A561QWN0_9HYPH|nr:hypothetical protein [Neorhizobium alkalisoli]TWF54758.1 hypothetical protein FHW37_103628 [Neorhizobium alkalisoli]